MVICNYCSDHNPTFCHSNPVLSRSTVNLFIMQGFVSITEFPILFRNSCNQNYNFAPSPFEDSAGSSHPHVRRRGTMLRFPTPRYFGSTKHQHLSPMFALSYWIFERFCLHIWHDVGCVLLGVSYP